MTEHRMPARNEVDPAFDGHHERPFAELSAEERLDWLWECMQLLEIGRRARSGPPGRPDAP